MTANGVAYICDSKTDRDKTNKPDRRDTMLANIHIHLNMQSHTHILVHYIGDVEMGICCTGKS